MTFRVLKSRGFAAGGERAFSLSRRKEDVDVVGQRASVTVGMWTSAVLMFDVKHRDKVTGTVRLIAARSRLIFVSSFAILSRERNESRCPAGGFYNALSGHCIDILSRGSDLQFDSADGDLWHP